MELRRILIGATVLLVILVASFALVISFIPTPVAVGDVVGVIDINDAILLSSFRDNVTKVIRRAIEDDSVKAVVLRIESPGGAASLVEEIYFNVRDLARRKPVIASIQSIAASGGYYIAVAAEYIYGQPTAIVGSVGILAIEPDIVIPMEGILETGPYKETGFSPRNFSRTISLSFDRFLDAVINGRQGRLKTDHKTLSKGMVYIGLEAVDLGLIDEIGSFNDAVNRAAAKAGISRYTVSYLNQLVLGPTEAGDRGTQWSEKITRAAMLASGEQSNLFFLYVPPAMLQGLAPERRSWMGDPELRAVSELRVGLGGRKVVLDVAHNNWITMFETSMILQRLTTEGASVSIVFTKETFLSSIREADALIIAAPYYPFEDEELEAVRTFVDRGGRLLLIGEPTRNVAFLDSVAMRFGIYYSHGYVSDPENSYFNYRNVEIREFGEDPLTRNLHKLVFFTATHIYSEDKGLAFTSDRAFLYPGEIPGTFTPLVVTEGGRVVALADFTMLTEPFVYVEDNYAFLLNLVDFLLGR